MLHNGGVSSNHIYIFVANKKEAIDYLNKYPYSSYLDFIGENRAQNKILNMEAFPKYFPNKTSFIEEIFEWLSLR